MGVLIKTEFVGFLSKPIEAPFANVASDVMDTQRISKSQTNWVWIVLRTGTIYRPGMVIPSLDVKVVSPSGSSPAGILPLDFGRQSEFLAGLLGQPIAVGDRILVCDDRYRMRV